MVPGCVALPPGLLLKEPPPPPFPPLLPVDPDGPVDPPPPPSAVIVPAGVFATVTLPPSPPCGALVELCPLPPEAFDVGTVTDKSLQLMAYL